MRTSPRVLAFIGLCVLAAGAPSAQAIDVGLLDDFQDGTVADWFGGTTITSATNGQLGPSDLFLRVDSNGNSGGSGAKVATHNSDARYIGDYLAAGVSALQVDMINLNTTTLRMRMVIFGLGSRWTSTNFVTLAPGSGWQHLTFPISSTDLTRVLGSGTYTDTLSNVNQLMFRHDASTPSSGGEALDGTIGLDNIRAIPAPGAAGALAIASLFAARRRRTR